MKNSLRVLRAAQRISQQDLALALGVSRQTINALENEKYDPSLPLAFRIAGLFGSIIEEIFEPEPDTAPAAHPEGEISPRIISQAKTQKSLPLATIDSE